MDSTALILEGGGMRGAFTAGVLDYWLDRNLMFRNVYGVSAGACQACSYLCRQKGRAQRIWINYCNDKRFCSFSSFLKTGDIFNVDFNYRQIPTELDPIDNDAYLKNDCRFYAVVTNLRTGQPEYLRVKDMFKDVSYVQASSSLPLLSRPVRINGQLYLDGGVADSIPLSRSIRDGYPRSILILTQPPGYRKSPNKAIRLIAAKYKAYPQFVETMRRRHEIYNQTLDLVESERRAGRAFVIQPNTAPSVGRIEHDPQKLQALYDMGYHAAEERYNELIEFLYYDVCCKD